MARVHVCSTIGCPNLQPCPVHGRTSKRRSNWSKRDQAQHMREARAAKRRHTSCQYCGSTEKLDYHHTAPGTGVVICNQCHVQVDPHARAR